MEHFKIQSFYSNNKSILGLIGLSVKSENIGTKIERLVWFVRFFEEMQIPIVNRCDECDHFNINKSIKGDKVLEQEEQ